MITNSHILAAYIGAIVENKSLEKALQDIGFSKKDILEASIARYSSDEGVAYVHDNLEEQLRNQRRWEGLHLYLVKKVFCYPEQYDAMGEAIHSNGTDHFKVLRLIGANEKLMHYKQSKQGLEVYLVSGKNATEAFRETTTLDPLLTFSSTDFTPRVACQVDSLFTTTILEHTPEAVEKYFHEVQKLF